MNAILALLNQLVASAPNWIAAGIDVAEMWRNIDRVREENRAPNDAEWDKLDAFVAQQKASFTELTKDTT